MVAVARQRSASSVNFEALTPFQSEQLRVERLKAWLTAGSIVATVGAAIVTYASTEAAQRRQAVDAFQLKAAEIAMASRTPWEAKGKMSALAALFPGMLSDSLARAFDPESQGWGRESRRELLAFLAAEPTSVERRAAILSTWRALFPGDTFVNSIPVGPQGSIANAKR